MKQEIKPILEYIIFFIPGAEFQLYITKTLQIMVNKEQSCSVHLGGGEEHKNDPHAN